MADREFNFGPGNPDPGVFPTHELGQAAQRVIARLGPELAHYPDQLGLPELRAVAAERFARNHGVRPPLEDIVITNGAMQGLILSAQALAQRGDSVVMEEFEYGGTIRVFKQYGLRLLGVPVDDDGSGSGRSTPWRSRARWCISDRSRRSSAPGYASGSSSPHRRCTRS